MRSCDCGARSAALLTYFGLFLSSIVSRLKEEERRKELMKMRDEARAARMAYLQKHSFDLTRGFERIMTFEDGLRARGSTALYPNHLGSAIKYYYMKDKSGGDVVNGGGGN